MNSLVFVGWLTFLAPEASLGGAYDELRERVAKLGEEDPMVAVAKLEAALAEVARHPENLSDPGQRELVRQARFALVWSQQKATGQVDDSKAVAWMDDAIRSALTTPLPTGYFDAENRDSLFGPDVADLYRARRTTLGSKGAASIDIQCTSCRVFVNETEIQGNAASHATGPLYLGTYRVVVVWADAGAANTTRLLTLEQVDEVHSWAPPSPTASAFDELMQEDAADESMPESTEDPQPAKAPDRSTGPRPANASSPPTNIKPEKQDRDKKKRMLPLAAEVTGLVAGVGIAAAGAVLLALDGRCPGSGDISSLEECPRLYDNQIQGITLLGVGAAAIVSWGAVLTIDQVRDKKSNRAEAMLVWTVRF